MTVNVTKPQINVREKLSELDKPSGIAGEAILRSETPQEVFNYINAGRRNLIINGAMQVAQRGTSFTGLSSSVGYTIDRMRQAMSGAGTHTITQSTDAPDGFANSWKLECTSATTPPSTSGYLQVTQAIEGQNLQLLKKGTSNAESLTVSFWVKGSKTGTHVFELYDNDNSRQVSSTYTINSAGTWEYKTITLAGDATGALDNDNNTSLYAIWWLAAGPTFSSGTLNTSWASVTSANRAAGSPNYGDTVGNTFQITGVQLEVGSVATPFEHRSFGEELALCQRYYQIIQEGAGSRDNQGNISVPGEQLIGLGFCLASNRVMGSYRYPHPMRAIPSSTVSFSSNISVLRPTGAPGGWSSATTVNIRATDKYARFDINGVSVTAGNACEIRIEASTGGKIEFDAEL